MTLRIAVAVLLVVHAATAAGTTFAASTTPAKAPAAAKAKASSGLPALLRAVEAKYTEAGTLQAEFEQEDESRLLNRKKKSTGQLAVERPDKIRWQTLTPDKNLFVTDGKTSWYYTPPFDDTEQGQLIERKSSLVASRLMNALISGSFSTAKGVKIAAKSGNQFELTFKAGSAGEIRSALLTIDSEKKLIQSVDLRHKAGNTTRITLTSIRLGDKFPPEFFKFDPPPGTQRSKE